MYNVSNGATLECKKWFKNAICEYLEMTWEEIKKLNPKTIETKIISDSDYSSDREKGKVEINGKQYIYWYFHNEKGSYITEV